MGKHRHKKSFYDVDEEELKSSEKHRHHHHQHHRHRHDRHHSNEKQQKVKKRISSPSPSSFYHIDRSDDDQSALQSPPLKRPRSTSQTSQSPSTVLSQLIENPEFLANAGPKAKEFAETARQLLSKPDLDPMTQQIICAMAQAAVNVGKRLSSSSSSTPADQCVDEISVTNSTTFSSTALLSPSLSNASSSSTSTTPQQQSHLSIPQDDHRTTSNESSGIDEDILIKQMIERAMKLNEQGDTKQAQTLLGIIHEKISKKRKQTAEISSSATNDEDPPVANDFYASSISSNESFYYSKRSPSIESEPLNDPSGTPNSGYPPPPPLPPPPPPPPSSIPVPPIEQVQELLSNPSELQDILKKLFGANDTPKVLPPEELQNQSHLTSPPSTFHVQNTLHYHPSARLNPPPPPAATTTTTTTGRGTIGSQPYNSSLAFMQGNRRNLPPLQAPDRCFSSSNTKSTTKSATSQSINRSFSVSSSTITTSIGATTTPLASLSAPPLMKMTPTYPLTSTSTEPMPSRWSSVHDSQYYNLPVGYETNHNLHHEPIRTYQLFRCATCALEFPHQIAYQDHLRSHVPCTVPGCSYAATEALVRIHHQNIHDNNSRNRLSSTSSRPIHYQQSSSSSASATVDSPWPLMRM